MLTAKLSGLNDLSITVSDVLEKNATDKERYAHIDIADWLIKWRAECIREYGGTEGVPIEIADQNRRDKTGTDPAECPTFDNPNMQLVAKYFPSEHWDALEQLINDLDLIPTIIRLSDPI